jgi:hypothetical protein
MEGQSAVCQNFGQRGRYLKKIILDTSKNGNRLAAAPHASDGESRNIMQMLRLSQTGGSVEKQVRWGRATLSRKTPRHWNHNEDVVTDAEVYSLLAARKRLLKVLCRR